MRPAVNPTNQVPSNSPSLPVHPLKIEYLAPSDIHPASRQVRQHKKDKLPKLKANIERFGVIVPILISSNREIIDGHAVWQAAQELGLPTIPTVMLGRLTQAEQSVLRIALNRLPQLAEWDEGALKKEFEILYSLDIDLAPLTGFDTPQIDYFMMASDAPHEPDAADELPAIDPRIAPVTRRGDLFLFKGGHRLSCEDARDGIAYAALMAGEKAHVVSADLPYGCAIEGHVSGLGKHKHKNFVMGAGEMNEPELQAFFTDIFRQLAEHTVDGAILFSFVDFRSLYPMLAAGRSVFTELKNICTWDKGSGGMGSLYRSASEFATVWKNGRAPHQNHVQLGKFGRSRTTVWQVPGLAQFGRGRDEALASHPTKKPTALIMDCILDVSSRGDIVLDPTVGSGTTLAAAHKTGRRGYGLELDPLYCDVAVKMMEVLTGEPAVHAETGLTFQELAERRAADAADAVQAA